MFILKMNLKNRIMEISIKKKFERKKKQNNPIGTTIDLEKNKDFNLDNKTIKEKQQNS